MKHYLETSNCVLKGIVIQPVSVQPIGVRFNWSSKKNKQEFGQLDLAKTRAKWHRHTGVTDILTMGDLELTGSRPPSVNSSRPSSRTKQRPRSGYKVISDSSNIDELLFSSHHPREEPVINFKAPWSNTPRTSVKTSSDKLFKKTKMRPLLWAPDDPRRTATSQSDRKIKPHNSVDHHLNRYRPVKQTPSFCDESLFGPRLEEPSFEAPWAEKSKKVKPYLFSPVDYARLTTSREGSTMSAKYSSSGTMDGRPPSRQGRRPITATTRPVTVESSYDIERPTWKP